MKKNIYILLQHLKMGGIEVCTINLANSLVKKGYKVILVLTLNTNEFEKNRIQNDVEIEYLTTFKVDSIQKKYNLIGKIFRRFFSTIALIKKIKSIKSGVIISTRNEYSVLLSKYGKSDVLKIAQLHHDYLGLNIENDFKFKYKNIDYFVQLTDEIKTEIEKIMLPHNQKTKIITIPNFLPTENLKINFTSQRKKVAVAVGRLSQEKGFLRLIDIWKDVVELKKSDESFELLIIGEGSERPFLEKKIAELKLNNSIKLLGMKDNNFVNIVMQSASVYCMTSFTEAFSMVILEAQKNGLPQIAYDVRVGPRNLIKNNITGYLIEENNSFEYAKKLVELLCDENLCSTFSKNSYEQFSNYTEEKVIKKWMKILYEN